MNLIEKVRQFLKDNKIDYLLVNSANEFLMEYSELEENARYHLTNFSGSTGDAVISQKDIFLFVDGRYHEQADKEVDKKFVKVVKMEIGASFSAELAEKLAPNKTFGVVSKKVSQGRLEILQTELKKKNIKIKLIDFDPILKREEGRGKRKEKFENIPLKITALSSEEKIKKVKSKLKKGEAVLVTNLEEISYLFNIRDFSKNYSSTVKRGPELISKDDDTNDVKTVFVDKISITAYDYAKLGEKAKPLADNFIKEMKAIKTKEEIAHLKKCFERADKALSATRKFIEDNENLSEYDITKNLEENFYKFGAKSLSFKSIVAKNKNAALAHYSQNSKSEIIKDGDLVLIDCGAYYEGGYSTDTTRVFVKGTPSKLQKKVYTVVLKGFLAAFNKKITEKTSGFALDKTARKILAELAPSGFSFSHSLGHGIGISVHESPPSLSPSVLAKAPLKVNMCFTIEPGLYNATKFGIRLENSCYLAKEKGELIIKSFSNMCFEEKLIDFDMLSAKEKKQLKNFEVK